MSEHLRGASVLVVGAGGLGSPAALALARTGIGKLTLLDDDVVDASNLHRQTLYRTSDVGRLKIEVAAERLRAEGARVVEGHVGRLLPSTALDWIKAHDLVLEGADNFATKFLAVDAAYQARRPVVQAGAVRWYGWALATWPGIPDAGCLRCYFEDIPRDRVETCAEAGVVGPVVGVLGAIQAALAIRTLTRDRSAAGELWSYDALAGRLRRTRVAQRLGCPLCAGAPFELTMERYVGPSCPA